MTGVRTSSSRDGRNAQWDTPPCLYSSVSVLVSGNDTGGRIAVIKTTERRGAEPPRHAHSHEDELVYVLEGRLVVDLGGQPLDCPAGSAVFLPRGSEHSFTVESEEARLLVVLFPAGLEDYFSESEESDGSGTRLQAIERLIVTAARYGVAITGPGSSSEF